MSVLERDMRAELTSYLGYEKHDPAGRGSGNSRNGVTSKTVDMEVGPIEVDRPWDRNGTFVSRLVPNGQRRLGEACQVVCVSGWVLDGLDESFGVADGEFVQGCGPAMDEGPFDEFAFGSALAVGAGCLVGSFAGSFVFDGADREPEQCDYCVVVGELAAVLMIVRSW